MSTEGAVPESKHETVVTGAMRKGEKLALNSKWANPISGVNDMMYYNGYHFYDGTLEITAINVHDATEAYRAVTKEVSPERFAKALQGTSDIQLIRVQDPDPYKRWYFKLFGIVKLPARLLTSEASLAAYSEHIRRKCMNIESGKVEGVKVTTGPAFSTSMSALLAKLAQAHVAEDLD